MRNLILLVVMVYAIPACSPKLSPDHYWANKQWVLSELKGVPVQQSGTDKDAHLVFMVTDKRLSGTGGCNRINGNYALAKNNAISFGNVASTMMACPDLAFEKAVLDALKAINNYSEETNTLILKKDGETVMKLVAR